MTGQLWSRPKAVPTVRLVLMLAAGGPLWLAALLVSGGWVVAVLYLAGLATAAAVDFLRLPAADLLEVERRLPRRFSLRAVETLQVLVRNRSEKPLEVTVRETFPPSLEPIGEMVAGLIPAGRTAQLSVTVKAVRRGEYFLSLLHLRLRRPGGLMARQLVWRGRDGIRVYPRLVGADDYRLLARLDERREMVRRPRLVAGAGMEWESLREYLPGEDLRNVDWKASARRGSLISRNLQVEKGQQVALLIDCGRLMSNQIAGSPRLEYAVNAAVMLSYACSRRGDAVSLAAFSNRIESYLPPTRGNALMTRVLDAVYKVECRDVESDYWEVVARVIGRLSRRSLVVMLTDVLDSWGSSGLYANLLRAANRHLVLCVVQSEPRVSEMAQSTPRDVRETYLKAAACSLRLERELALESMRSRGIQVLETEPSRLSVRLVQRYLEIRQGGLQ